MNAPALFAVATLIWGSTWLAITFQLGTVPPEVSVAYRFALAGLLLAAWCAATGRPLAFTRRQHAFIAAQGALMFGFNYIAVYWAEQHVPSGLVAVLFSTIVFMSPIGMRLAFGTPIRGRMLVAATLGVGGVALLFVPQIALASAGGATALGIGYALLATFLATAGNLVAVRNQGAKLPVLPSTAWGMLYGAAITALAAIVTGVPWTFDASVPYLLSLAYLAVFGSVIAFGAYLTLLARVGAGPSAFVGVSTPVIAMALSTAFEGYRWTAPAAAGVVLAVAGNLLALWQPRRRSHRPG